MRVVHAACAHEDLQVVQDPEDAASTDFKIPMLPGRLDVVGDFNCRMDEIGGMASYWQHNSI
eukprot:443596-Alexandrium_andersonii.AAC.1